MNISLHPPVENRYRCISEHYSITEKFISFCNLIKRKVELSYYRVDTHTVKYFRPFFVLILIIAAHENQKSYISQY